MISLLIDCLSDIFPEWKTKGKLKESLVANFLHISMYIDS